MIKLEELSMLGIELLGQCVDCSAEYKMDSPDVTFKLKILDVVYSVQVAHHEAMTIEGARSAWKHLLEQFFLRHAAGNRQLYAEGSRELTEEEQKMLAQNKLNRREKRALKLINGK